jgi:chromatin remodeling complex protein RSC6
LSGDLENLIGKGPMTRAQVTSKVWDYIKANKLQDSTDKRQINPDGKLGAVIGNKQISMFAMTAAVSKHLS